MYQASILMNNIMLVGLVPFDVVCIGSPVIYHVIIAAKSQEVTYNLARQCGFKNTSFTHYSKPYFSLIY